VTTHLASATSDALTNVDRTSKFDVTYLPRKIEELLEQTDKPLHRAILKNFLRHAVLEISGYWDRILVPELTIDEPVYRISERGDTHVLTGKSEVEGFYRRVFETRTNVMGTRALNLCVADFGVVMEAVFGHVVPGSQLRADEIDADSGAYYLVSHHIAAEPSRPSTTMPRAARGIATRPVPTASSRTRPPSGTSPARNSTAGAGSRTSVWSYSWA
jgi:hypothetical protein